jgi:hypothetical protein
VLTRGKNSQIFHFWHCFFKNMTILSRNLKKFECLSNFVTLKADIYETMHFYKILHKDKSSQNCLFSIRSFFAKNEKNKINIDPNLWRFWREILDRTATGFDQCWSCFLKNCSSIILILHSGFPWWKIFRTWFFVFLARTTPKGLKFEDWAQKTALEA